MKNNLRHKTWQPLNKYQFDVILKSNATIDLGILAYKFNDLTYNNYNYQYKCDISIPCVEVFIFNGNIITELPKAICYKADGGLYIQLDKGVKIVIGRISRFNFELTYTSV
jgi:hypothetical protein